MLAEEELMAQISVIERKCTGCEQCLLACPFSAIDMMHGKAQMNAACKVCGLCIKACPQGAIIRLETKVDSVDKTKWSDILVFAEMSDGKLHPVCFELIGEAQRLVAGGDQKVKAVIVGEDAQGMAQELCYWGVEEVHIYEGQELSFFRADAFASCVEDCIKKLKPSVVLVGATALGRSLAPRLSTRFHTGLTADCTQLKMKENTDLVQIRPAFGGNIMAQIVTPNTRPQFATVRYKVMEAPKRMDIQRGEVIVQQLPKAARNSRVKLISMEPVPKVANISDAEILVVAGRGIQKKEDLELVKELAGLLGGEYAVTRPLAEKGWESNLRQIGLSGRTVRPKLILTFGVSGAIQFTAGMDQAEQIIAVNSDKNAPIFKLAHIGIVADLYEMLPRMISLLKEKEA